MAQLLKEQGKNYMIPYTPGINVSGIRSRELNETKYFLMLQNMPSLDQSLLYIYYNRITGEGKGGLFFSTMLLFSKDSKITEN